MTTNLAGRRQDLRTRRTEAHLREALQSLLSERGYEQTSVVDVCERAMVHRTTFYKHYAGKAELLDDLIEDHVARLVDPDAVDIDGLVGPAGREQVERVLVEILERAERARSFYTLLADDALSAPLAAKLTRALGRHLVGDSHRPPSAPGASAATAFRAHLHAGMVVNTIAWTMHASHALAPTDLARIVADEFIKPRG